MSPSPSHRRELLEIWETADKGKGKVLFPPDLSKQGGPPSHLSKPYRRLWLDHLGNSLYLDSILKKGWEHTPRPWRRLLALAFSELQWSQEKDVHGVVHDWVEQARVNLGEKAVKVVNGTLRTSARDLDKGKAPKHGLPKALENFLGGWKGRLLLEQASPLLAFLPETQSNENLPLNDSTPIDHPGLGRVHQISSGTSPQSWLNHHEGGFIQNLSAAEVAMEVKTHFLGTSFLDYCAAPGGKTWQLLRLGLPSLTFHDHSPKRKEKMLSSPTGKVYGPQLTPLHLESDALYDGVLIDVPCSNSGVLSKCPEAVKHYWEPKTSFADLQEEVFLASLNLLKPRGQIFYSTCSIDPVENEERVSHFSDRYDMDLVYKKQWVPDENGRHGAFLAELKNCE